jgi:hypothetical protein
MTASVCTPKLGPFHANRRLQRERLTNFLAGLDLAIARGWLVLHESGTYVKFTQAGAELFA